MFKKLNWTNLDETRNYFIKEIDQNDLMNKKYKKIFTTLNYIEHFLNIASVVNGCISVTAFASLLGILIGITSSAIGSKICAPTARIKNV